ncbi:MAG: hypothetical protein ACE5GM_10455 [bacterium]
MKKHSKWFLIFCLWGSLACGNITSSIGKDFDAAKTASLIKGKTTAGQVIESFGLPIEIRKINHNGMVTEIWYYRYLSDKADRGLEITFEKQRLKDFKVNVR